MQLILKIAVYFNWLLTIVFIILKTSYYVVHTKIIILLLKALEFNKAITHYKISHSKIKNNLINNIIYLLI